MDFWTPPRFLKTGTGDSQRNSRESIRANHSQLKPLFPILANLAIRLNHSNFRFTRITPLRSEIVVTFLGNGQNTVSRVLFLRRELTEPH